MGENPGTGAPAAQGRSTRRREPQRSPRNPERREIAPPIHFGDAIHTLLSGSITSERAIDEGRSLNECELCAQKNIAYGAVGKCNHAELMCWICAVRLRLLAVRQEENLGSVEFHCPYDNELSPQVLLTQQLCAWESVHFGAYDRHQETSLYFSDPKVAKAFHILQEIRCWFPECFAAEKKFDGMEELKAHLLDEHNRKFCDICYRAKYPRLFLPEHVLYDPLDLARHRRLGDNHIDPHVFCRACRQYLFDAQDMEMHWRGSNDHFCCRLCRANGMQTVVFSSYALLWDHHVANHFPCVHEECKQAEIVFANSNDLQLHMATKHYESSEFYSSVGRRGVRLNLSAYAQAEEAAAQKRTKRGGRHKPSRGGEQGTDSGTAGDTTPEPALTHHTDPICALWPLEMIAEGDALLTYMSEVPKQYASAKACSDAMSRLYNTHKAQFFQVDREWRQITSECEAMVRNTKPKPVDQAIGTIARIIFSRWQWWVSKVSASRMLEASPPGFPQPSNGAKVCDQQSSDASPQAELSTPKWLSVSGNLSAASEILLVLILAVPPDLPETRETMKSIITRIAAYAPDARKDLSRTRDEKHDADDDQPALPESPGSESPRDAAPSGVLSRCDALPINPNISFLEAVTFALDEFIRETETEKVLRNRQQWGEQLKACPVKVPKGTLTRMRSQYRKVDLENFKNLERDLSQFISTPLLEKFKALLPWYVLKRKQIKDVLSSQTAQSGGSKKSTEQINQILHGENSTKWSREWGSRCDTVFQDLNPPQLLLLRHYVMESIAMSQNACGVDEDLISGVDKALLEKCPDVTPQTRTFYDSRSHTIQPSDFPELPTASVPQVRPPAWGARHGEVFARAPASRAQPAQTRTSRTAHRSGSGGWGMAACNHCGAQTSRAQGVCNACRQPLRSTRGSEMPPPPDEFPRLQTFINPGTRY
eukprot:Gregarina_sp_Pseudo_9__4017@NODE_415_length_2881_cov_5_790640_g392_i0_p1_GENE_NODE_415_length_2881_cov_5_790640_g392_i0NODE_415_length_2881_cov_5_790640_g392_i0_p1_ORF_typecomplete_len938_score221_00DUF3528/PF12045_8/0_055Rubredoxin_2/PF18073_1/1_8e04Rubredoxin_2/PF18073_1/0_036_NODE_415_length_2881_cov_5_790640_g392_i0422855